MIRNGFIKTMDAGWIHIQMISRIYILTIPNMDEKDRYCVYAEFSMRKECWMENRLSDYFDTRESAESFLHDMMKIPFGT